MTKRARRPTKAEVLQAELDAANRRIATLEAVCDRVYYMFHKEWTDGDQQAALRACRAAVEHREIVILPLKDRKPTK